MRNKGKIQNSSPFPNSASLPAILHPPPKWCFGSGGWSQFLICGPFFCLLMLFLCFRLGPYHEMQTFRNRLFQQESPMTHRSCQKTCSCVGSRLQLLPGPCSGMGLLCVEASFRAYPPGVLQMLHVVSALLWVSVGPRSLWSLSWAVGTSQIQQGCVVVGQGAMVLNWRRSRGNGFKLKKVNSD